MSLDFSQLHIYNTIETGIKCSNKEKTMVKFQRATIYYIDISDYITNSDKISALKQRYSDVLFSDRQVEAHSRDWKDKVSRIEIVDDAGNVHTLDELLKGRTGATVRA